MLLSNHHAAAFIIVVTIFTAASCSWFRSDIPPTENAPIATPVSSIPFETKEPETYQADFVTMVLRSETRSHFARKGDKWRFDSFTGDSATRSIINSDKLIYIDHASKTFSEAPSGGLAQPDFLADLTTSLSTQSPSAKFEKLSTEGNIEKYRVTADGSNAPAVIHYDTGIKMVTRHEMGDNFAFDMRNFTLNVDDSLFLIPSGYRKIPWADFKKK